MPEVLVLNPRARRDSRGRFLKRRRVNARRRRRRNPIAAVAAANPRRSRRRRHVNARRRRRRNPIAAFAANPRRRRYRHVNARRSRRRRHNPRLLSVSGLTSTLMPAVAGGAGALGLDIALGYLPAEWTWAQQPLAKNLIRVVGALALGTVAGMAVNRRIGTMVTTGALTVAAYGAMRDLFAQVAPAAVAGISPPPYGDYSDTRIGFVNPAPMLSAYMRSGGAPPQVGAYMRDSMLDTVNVGGMGSYDGM